AINGFLFFRNAYLSDTASLRPMLDQLPWLFLFFVPAVTMRALAEDIRGGQIEVVLAQPLSELELVLGKYLGAVLFLWTALALTLVIPLGLSLGSDLPWGTIVAQYAGAALLAAGLAGIGVWASSLARSQITAFIVAAGVMFLLVLVGLDPLLVGLPPGLGAVAARIGILSHFDAMGRGVIDLRDVIYFVSLAGIFLALATGALLGRKLAPVSAAHRRLRLGVTLLTASLVVVNLVGGYIGGRLDLSPGRAYTLAPASRRIVRELDDLVTVTLYATRELPTEVALMKRDVDDLLRDLRSAGRGRLRVVERDPGEDETARREAETAGIQPVQFNVIGQSELQVKQGYLGLALQHGAESEVIPFVQRTDDLEYRLVSAIRHLTRERKPVVGVVSDAEGPGISLQELQQQLASSYEVRQIELADTAQPAADVVALILAGTPDSLTATQQERLRRYFERGGAALVLAPGMRLSQGAPMAEPRPVAWNAVLKPYGVAIRSDMAYDLLANEVIPLPTDFGRVLQVYPFFIRAQSSRLSPVNQDLGAVVLTWASTIDTTGAARGTITPLLTSSPATGAFTALTSIAPTQDFPQDKLAPRLLGVTVAPPDSAGPRRGRLAVVGSLDFATDRFVRTAPENLAFALNAVDWLAQDEALIAIRSKDRRPPPLLFQSAATREGVKYANLIGLPVLVAIAGLARLLRRRRRTREPYRPLVPAREGAA
ncbi:MAG TPA: Gldg family protein, partial [Gemmatimonadales bacterium]|nr:Gldg family protein [Gemmatimonadales bacterium]